jgi:hypothetical protein
MTAIEFLNLNVDKKLIVSYRSTANPQWKEIAYCPHDFMGNSVTQIAIEPNPTEWERQIDEYESEAE